MSFERGQLLKIVLPCGWGVGSKNTLGEGVKIVVVFSQGKCQKIGPVIIKSNKNLSNVQ